MNHRDSQASQVIKMQKMYEEGFADGHKAGVAHARRAIAEWLERVDVKGDFLGAPGMCAEVIADGTPLERLPLVLPDLGGSNHGK